MSNSILSRFVISVSGNTFKAAISFATGLLIARELGPEEYGVFAFLLASFTALNQLLDMGSSNAFYTFISKKIPSRTYFVYYIIWMVCQFSVSIFLIGLLAPDSWIDRIWQGESRERILIAFVAVFLQQQVWQMIAQVGESQRLTSLVQSLNIKVALLQLAVVVMLIWLGQLSIELIYLVISVEFIIASVISYYTFPLQFSKESVGFRKMLGEYKRYCMPLIPYAWLSMVSAFADTWLLQRYGGSVQQAYFSIAMQFSAISLIATRSILRIIWKEIAETYSQGNYERALFLFSRSTRILYILGAVISGFLIPWTTEIINLALGEAYLGGVVAMSIMFIYPINQARGQVAGAMFLAMEKTKPYVVIGMVSMVISTVAAYFMLASPEAIIPGFGLGATGIAIKMVVIELLSVNLSIWWISRRLDGQFEWVYQFIGIGIFLLLGYLSYIGSNGVLGESSHVTIRGAVAGLTYLLSALFVLYIFPAILGMSRDQVDRYIGVFIGMLRKLVRKNG